MEAGQRGPVCEKMKVVLTSKLAVLSNSISSTGAPFFFFWKQEFDLVSGFSMGVFLSLHCLWVISESFPAHNVSECAVNHSLSLGRKSCLKQP